MQESGNERASAGLSPIAAISTPPGTGAVAVIRVSGAGAKSLVTPFFTPASRWENATARRAVYGKLCSPGGGVVDEVLCTWFRAPASFTGEEMVEISCHGGPVVTGAVLELVLSGGARAAEPGEFTFRAFSNGRMDLTQAEAVMDLITAKSRLAARAAVEQMGGQIGVETGRIRSLLLGALAHLEAWIDFPEEGIDPATETALAEKFRAVGDGIARLLQTAQDGRILREGVRLAIVGAPNAGKSSLLNRLLGQERAIVNEAPGTTRDTIEEFLSLKGLPFRVVDTAGLRESGEEVELLGMERTRQAILAADLLLEVRDATQPREVVHCPEHVRRVLVWNKLDVCPDAELPPQALGISCRTGQGLEMLVERIVEESGFSRFDGEASLCAINARHRACLQSAAVAIEAAVAALLAGQEPELVAVEARTAMSCLGEISGRVDDEELLGEIFQSFCIGK